MPSERTKERCHYCWGPVGEVRISRGGRLYCCQSHAYHIDVPEPVRLAPVVQGQLELEDEG